MAASHDRKSVYVTDMGAISKMFDPDKERTLALDSKQAKELPAQGCVYKISIEDGKITDAIAPGQADMPARTAKAAPANRPADG